MPGKKSSFPDSGLGASIMKLVKKSDHRVLAVWAADCASRVLPLFEKKCPDDGRPREAIEGARLWARTGIFHMASVRGTALASHAAARRIGGNEAACFAARSAGHAIATAHVGTHSIACAWYAAKAVWAADPENARKKVAGERQWQYKHLVGLEAARKRKIAKKG